MKKILTSFLLSFVSISTHAQINGVENTGDSLRIIELREIVVTAVKKTSQQRLVSFFKATSASTTEDIMARLPELSMLRRGAYGMEPAIRSFNGGQINVQVDGMRIHGACTDKMDPATIYIEPINLENLQVQTTANGFISGSAIGGTINMKMAEPDYANNNTITGMINSGYQSAANSFYEAAKLNYSSGKWAFRTSATYRNNQNYRSGGGGDPVKYSQFEKLNYSLSAKFQQNQYTYIKADLLGDDGWNIGYSALPMDVGYAAARIASFSIHHNNPLKRLYKWQFKIYTNTIRHFMDDSKRPSIPMHMDMPGISKTFGVFTEAELRLNHKQKLSLRADGSSGFLTASMTMYQPGQPPMFMLTWPDNRKNQYGLSASWLWLADSSIKVQVVGRVDFIAHYLVSGEAKDQVSIFGYPSADRKDLLKNLSVQLSKNINRKMKLTASLSYTERMPAASELYGFYLFNSNDGYDYIGNPKLNAEKSLQADVSASCNWNQNRIQVSIYHARINNFISGLVAPSVSAMTAGATGVKSYINSPYATLTGMEISGILKPANSLDIISTLRYTVGNDNTIHPLPYIAPLKNITSIIYQLKNISFQLESDAAMKQNRVSSKAGEDITAGYFLLHTRFGYTTTLFKSNITFQAGVENIFDKKYHDHLDWGNIARPGRNVYTQMKVSF